MSNIVRCGWVVLKFKLLAKIFTPINLSNPYLLEKPVLLRTWLRIHQSGIVLQVFEFSFVKWKHWLSGFLLLYFVRLSRLENRNLIFTCLLIFALGVSVGGGRKTVSWYMTFKSAVLLTTECHSLLVSILSIRCVQWFILHSSNIENISC